MMVPNRQVDLTSDDQGNDQDDLTSNDQDGLGKDFEQKGMDIDSNVTKTDVDVTDGCHTSMIAPNDPIDLAPDDLGDLSTDLVAADTMCTYFKTDVTYNRHAIFSNTHVGKSHMCLPSLILLPY